MASTFAYAAIISAKYAENAQETQYTAENTRARIDAFTATNVSGANATITVNLVPTGSSPDASNIITQARIIAPGEAYTFRELVGHVLNPGDYISTLASAASAIVIRCSGVEFTN